MYNKHKTWLGIFIGLLVLLVLVFGVYWHAKSKAVLPTYTYFNYQPEQIDSLKKLNSDKEITVNKLKKWDDITFALIRENKLGDKDVARIFSYLYTAQRDAAFLSFNAKHQFAGSLDPINTKVLCLFFNKECKTLTDKKETDAYSEKLSDIVFTQVNARFIAEKNGIKLYPEKNGSEYWKGNRPYFGQEAGTYKTWFLSSSSEFRSPTPPAPNDLEWQRQTEQTKNALQHITPPQIKAVVFWAGGPGTITPPGQWLTLANDYMWSQPLPLAKIILIRSVLAMGIADSAYAVFDSKYTYWAKRPFMRDNSIQSLMPTPNHPSYPAGHATISSAAATVLVYYFPEQKKYWLEQAQEAGNSRVWGGIHFPIDNEQGHILGTKVGNKAIEAQHGLAQ